MEMNAKKKIIGKVWFGRIEFNALVGQDQNWLDGADQQREKLRTPLSTSPHTHTHTHTHTPFAVSKSISNCGFPLHASWSDILLPIKRSRHGRASADHGRDLSKRTRTSGKHWPRTKLDLRHKIE